MCIRDRFQVDYAAEARQFLSTFFDKLTLVTFKRLVFDDIQQEVILLLGERGCNKHGIRVVELEDMSDLIEMCIRDRYGQARPPSLPVPSMSAWRLMR